MTREKLVLRQRHRGYCLEVFDVAGSGWRIVSHRPEGVPTPPDSIVNRMPSGLEILLEEARQRIDRLLDPATI